MVVSAFSMVPPRVNFLSIEDNIFFKMLLRNGIIGCSIWNFLRKVFSFKVISSVNFAKIKGSLTFW